jgi:hypothetical protein
VEDRQPERRTVIEAEVAKLSGKAPAKVTAADITDPGVLRRAGGDQAGRLR